mgnify:CR=1 FL=1
MRSIVLLEEALEVYWNKKRALHLLKYVSEKYSIFDFLHQLGVYFDQHYDFHHHTLFDVFDALSNFINLNYKEDNVLERLLSFDYHLNYKVKPQQRYLSEVDKSLKNDLIMKYKLDHHHFRFVIFEVNSGDQKYFNINPADQYVVIKYSGNDKPAYFGVQ